MTEGKRTLRALVAGLLLSVPVAAAAEEHGATFGPLQIAGWTVTGSPHACVMGRATREDERVLFTLRYDAALNNHELLMKGERWSIPSAAEYPAELRIDEEHLTATLLVPMAWAADPSWVNSLLLAAPAEPAERVPATGIWEAIRSGRWLSVIAEHVAYTVSLAGSRQALQRYERCIDQNGMRSNPFAPEADGQEARVAGLLQHDR